MSLWRRVESTAPGGRRIHAEVRESTGHALMLIPGTWGNAHTRGPLVERLNPDLTLVCIALAGQDDNWPPPPQPSIPHFTDDVRSLADTLSLGHFFVAGNSLGGMIAIYLLRLCPDRILGAISVEGWTHWTAKQAAFKNDTSSTLSADQREFLQQVRHGLLGRWDPKRCDEFGTMWTDWNGWEILETTRIPILEIWGDRGPPRPTRQTMRIPDRKNIQLAWIANASHNLLIEAPARLAELMNNFVRDVGRSSSDK